MRDNVAESKLSVNFLTALSELYEENKDSELTIKADWNKSVRISLPIDDNAKYAGNFLLEIVDKTIKTCTIRKDTRFIFNKAFSGCTQLVSVDIPDSVIVIGSEAFYGCM